MTDATVHLTAHGRFAHLIAIRGGKADPEAPFVIEHREALIYMLCQAAELEHGIMCQYLYAAFSLKQTEEEGLAPDEAEAANRWRRVISHVAAEEMLHLALVQNLLTAIGSAPHLSRPNLPAPTHHYPAGVHLALRPFGEEALRHFMFLERPEGMQLNDPRGYASAVADAVPAMGEDEIVPHLQDFATISHLYRSIEQGLGHLSEKIGEEHLFIGPPQAQATSRYFHWPELVAVTDLRTAQQAVDTILEQGEGARGDWQDAHFGQFVAILDEYRTMRKSRPDFDPVRPVLGGNVRPSEHVEGVPLLSDPLFARCVDLFNVGYEILLQTLERYFAHTEETAAQLATLSGTSMAIMLRVLRPLGELLPTLPAGPEHPGRTAAASFELFYEDDYLMPHRAAAWALLEERLRDAASFCRQIEADAEPELAEQLAPIGDAMSGMADDLAEHFPEWGAFSRFSPTAASSTMGDPDSQSESGPEGAPPDDAAAAPLPSDGEPISFEADIKPLFREGDRRSMNFAFDLWSYDDVSSRAAGILQRLEDGSMPCDGAWPAAQVQTFRRWTETGMQR